MSASSASRLVRWRERGTNVLCGRQEHSSGSGLTPKNLRAPSTMSAQRALSTCTIALHHGESGKTSMRVLDLYDRHAPRRERYVNVLCGRREHSGGGGPTPKKGIEHRERNKSASRLVRSPCQMARAVQTSYVDGESTQRRRSDAKEGHRVP
jgi:hypothetical protein